MAAISITVANVLPSNANAALWGFAGAAITQGQSLYVDTANNNVLKLYDADGVAPANVFAGISINAASIGQPIDYIHDDPSFTFGGTVLQGDTIWGSPTAGGITKTQADLIAGTKVTFLGIAISTTTMILSPVTPSTGGTVQ